MTEGIDSGVRADLGRSPGSITSHLGSLPDKYHFLSLGNCSSHTPSQRLCWGRQSQHIISLATVIGPGMGQAESFPEFFQIDPGAGGHFYSYNPDLLRSFFHFSSEGLFETGKTSSENENQEMGGPGI